MDDRAAEDAQFEQLLKEAARDVVALSANTTLLDGRFTVGCRLGSGSMGVVYEAMDRVHKGKVALKVLSEVNPFGIYRLKQEFRALTGVVHPNLVVLHELFFDDGLWFFTMDLVIGQSLIEHLNVEFDLPRIKRVFSQLAEGISAIHAAGKLHRDLKPSNVLVTPMGEVEILDFGLISDQTVGGAGQTLLPEGLSGTPTYMAPEQAAMGPAVPGSDWYAFGVMLFEVLTGRPPFEDTPSELLERKQREEAPRAGAINQGVPPELDQLCCDLLRLHPEERGGYEEILRALGEVSTVTAGPAGVDDTPFVGREKELGLLEEALKATDIGAPVVVFVEGLSGIGKSTLVERFLEQVALSRNAVILKGRCYERESVPYKACDSLIDELTRHLRRLPEQHAARLMPRNVASLAKIFPVLNRSDVVKATKQRHRLPPNPNELRRLAFSAAKELLSRISSQDPLLLYVDDLQWSDVDGVKLLSSIVTRPEPPSLLLIGAYRAEDASSSFELSLFREKLRATGVDVRTIVLGQLSEEDGCRLAADLLEREEEGLASKIHHEAEGSPFFIAELARYAAVSAVTADRTRLTGAIEHRVTGLRRPARELMELIAVSGRPTEERLLEAALNRGQLAGSLRTLESIRLIRQTGGQVNRVACYHDRIREAVVYGLSPGRLAACHRMLVLALEMEKSPDPISITEHLLGAGELARAGEFAVKAARLAAETLAFDNAARFFRIALELHSADRACERRLQAELGEALANAGRGADAASAYMQAARDAPPGEALTLRCLAAQQWINTGHMEAGTRELDRVLRAVGLRFHTKTASALWALIRNRVAVRRALPKIGRKIIQPVTDEQVLEIRACEAAMFGLWAADTLQSSTFCSRYLASAIEAGFITEIVKGLSSEACFRSTQGAKGHRSAKRFMIMAERLGGDLDDPEIRAYLQLANGMFNFTQGALREAEASLQRAERVCLAECTSRKSANLEMTQAFLGAAYARVGSWDALQRGWDRWVANAEEMGNLHHLAVCRMWFMGSLRWLAADQVETAREQLERGAREWPWPRFDLQRSQSFIAWSYLHMYSGEPQLAFDMCGELMKRFYASPLSRMEIFRVLHSIDYAFAALALAAKEKNPAHPLSVAEKQIRQIEQEKTPFGGPFATFIQGAVTHRRGDLDDGVRLLRQAVEELEGAKFFLHAAGVKRRLGRIVGGDEGASLLVESRTAMRKERIASLEKATVILAPGF